MYVFVSHVFGVHRSQKRVLGPLRIETDMVVSHSVYARNETRSSGRVDNTSNC